MSNDNHARDLSGEIDRLSRDGRHRPDEWLRFLVGDVLAGFGKRLETPWSAYHREHLLHLSGRYARLVAENPWRDILGGAYMELVVYRGNALGPESDLDLVIHRVAPPGPERPDEPQPLVLPAKAPERMAVIEAAAQTRSVSRQLSFDRAQPAREEA